MWEMIFLRAPHPLRIHLGFCELCSENCPAGPVVLLDIQYDHQHGDETGATPCSTFNTGTLKSPLALRFFSDSQFISHMHTKCKHEKIPCLPLAPIGQVGNNLLLLFPQTKKGFPAEGGCFCLCLTADK